MHQDGPVSDKPLVDIMDREGSFHILMGYVEREEEAPITSRSMTLIRRLLANWSGLYKMRPARLTVEGACALLAKWSGYDKENAGGSKDAS